MTTTRFRKRPVEIDAIRWSGLVADLPAAVQFLGSFLVGTEQPYDRETHGDRMTLIVKTLHGPVPVEPGCYAAKGERDAWPVDPEQFAETYERVGDSPAATGATELETTARVLSALHQVAEDTVTRVITLHEQWVAAGPPPLGAPLARWWDARLVELHKAIVPAAESATPAATEAIEQSGLRARHRAVWAALTPEEQAARLNALDEPVDTAHTAPTPSLVAESASDLTDDLSLQLYRAQDALAFVAECCTIAERDERTISTADVREWLKGARCARQMAAEQDARVDWQAIAERRERELKTVGEARHAAEQRAENFVGRARAYEQRAQDRADRIDDLTARRDALRQQLAEQEAETMRQHERAQQAEAAIARVRALHRPADHRGLRICVECSGYDGSSTDNSPCGYEHCPTNAALEGLPSSATAAVVDTARQEMVAELGDDHRNVQPEEALAYHAMGLSIRVERAEAERDGAYRERAYLVALLAAMTDGAVIAPAVDVEEPGWQIVYLTIGGRQAAWHISPRDAGLFACVPHVDVDHPSAQWDGHTTDDKYADIRQHTRDLFHQCGPACAEGHTYTGRCEGAHQVDDSDTTPPDVVHPATEPQASNPQAVDE